MSDSFDERLDDQIARVRAADADATSTARQADNLRRESARILAGEFRALGASCASRLRSARVLPNASGVSARGVLGGVRAGPGFWDLGYHIYLREDGVFCGQESRHHSAPGRSGNLSVKGGRPCSHYSSRYAGVQTTYYRWRSRPSYPYRDGKLLGDDIKPWDWAAIAAGQAAGYQYPYVSGNRLVIDVTVNDGPDHVYDLTDVIIAACARLSASQV